MGMAIKGDNADVEYYFGDGDKIVVLAYSLPFLFIFVLLLLLFLIVWCYVPWEDVNKTIKESPRWQANIFAAVVLCGMFCIYTFIMDVVSWVTESDVNSLPSYYKQITDFVLLTKVCIFFYMLFFVFVIVEAFTIEVVRKKFDLEESIKDVLKVKESQVGELNV